MRKYSQYIGLPFVYAGVAILALAFIFNASDSNAVLFTGLFFILVGTVGFIINTKKTSKY
ncbi:MAG: hypothetical protein MSD82_09045 [Prevotella sp.]|nr:hypothetical protein [Prevotella sp.]